MITEIKENTPLSASRIKNLKSCSFSYYLNYILRLPQKSHPATSVGTICHLIFEVLGDPKRRKYFDKIIKKKNLYSVKSIKRLVAKHIKKENLGKEHLPIINELSLKGLNFDFFGEGAGLPDEVVSEKKFDINFKNDGKNYRIKGFIDKLFIYKKENLALVRDYKTSKKKFDGKDLEDNMQHLIYTLAIRHVYPDIKHIRTQFVFLKFDMDAAAVDTGILEMPALSKHELSGFEMEITEVQDHINGFGEKEAYLNFAASHPIPKDGSFSGKLSCGFAKYPGHLKKDGSPMWHCVYKFPFKYCAVVNKEGKIIASDFVANKDILKAGLKEGETLKFMDYNGCPHFN